MTVWLDASWRGRLKGRLSAHAGAISISVLNQAVSSGTNFALGFYLVRTLAAEEFGAYGLGLSMVYLFSGIGNALFLTQMTVHAPDRPEHDRRPYAARVLAAVALACGSFLSVVVAAGCAAARMPHSEVSASFPVSIAFACVGFLLKDYFVREAYMERSESRALAVNVIVASTMIVLLLLAGALARFSAAVALLIFAVAQLAGALVGLALARLPLRQVTCKGIFRDFSSVWAHGRWALGGVGVVWAQSQGYAYVTLAALGAGGVGRANAARLLIAPFLFLLPAVNQVTTPRLAEMRTRDRRQMKRTASAITVSLSVMAVAYSAGVVASAPYLAPLVLGPGYAGTGSLIAAWSVVLVATVLRDGAGTLFQVTKRFRALTTLNALSASVALGTSIVLMHYVGAAGAVLGTAVGELVLGLYLWKTISREERETT